MTIPSDSTGASGSSLRTRSNLVQRLQSADEQGWREFYAIYGGLIRTFALRAGLTADEAEEVVQETAIGVAQGMPEFVYDPKVCRFKTWLLNQARWRILNQLRRRPRVIGSKGSTRPVEMVSGVERGAGEGTGGGDALAHVPDPMIPEFGAEWDKEWEKRLVAQALERIGERVGERQLQIFDLHVTHNWAAAEVASTFGISVLRVYLTKHRITTMLKQEVRRLERRAEQALRKPASG